MTLTLWEGTFVDRYTINYLGCTRKELADSLVVVWYEDIVTGNKR